MTGHDAGTICEYSHVPLHKWIYAMYLIVTARNTISSLNYLGKYPRTDERYFVFKGFLIIPSAHGQSRGLMASVVTSSADISCLGTSA